MTTLTTMTTEAKIIRIGNSRGMRLKQRDLDNIGIREGDRVKVTVEKAEPDSSKAIAALRAIADGGGPLTKIDMKKWEAERRTEWEKREKQLRDILGH